MLKITLSMVLQKAKNTSMPFSLYLMQKENLNNIKMVVRKEKFPYG